MDDKNLNETVTNISSQLTSIENLLKMQMISNVMESCGFATLAEMESALKELKTASNAKVLDGEHEKVFIQYGGKEWDVFDIKEKTISAHIAEGYSRDSIKKIALYVKPEEQRVYYVVNDEINGNTSLEPDFSATSWWNRQNTCA